uniref:Uncharacterized protein n=1 Tax=Siphoviridae sp. ctsAY3 TaxID=2827281 RepID=A0A8S5R3S2_9CAUD|nr:MAG TPA: hypothetical protein [Siphoviridae sp. ctsAY3]
MIPPERWWRRHQAWQAALLCCLPGFFRFSGQGAACRAPKGERQNESPV